MNFWLPVWHFLMIHNFFNVLVSWTTATIFGTAASYLPVKRHFRKQNDIADKLDTSTPGGMRDIALLLAAQARQNPPPEVFDADSSSPKKA